MTAQEASRGAGTSIEGAVVLTTGAPASPRQWIVTLPYVEVPLSLNDRLHPQAKGRKVAEIKQDVTLKIKAARIPRLERCRVEMHFVPPDRRRRDRDNLVATYKPACDAVVAAGVVEDDAPEWMDQIMPIIDPPQNGAPKSRLYLVITDLGGAA